MPPIDGGQGGAVAVLAALALAAVLLLVPGLAHGGDPDARPADRYARPVVEPAVSRVPSYPSSMDALGGSVTVGFNTDCPDPWVDCPENSWATGSNAAVNSIYLRLLALDPKLKGNAFNDAESGTTMADLDRQAHSAVERGADLVLVAMGTNDACGARTGAMTEVPAFRVAFANAMHTLTTGLPQARIHVVSIPDLYQRWETLHKVPRVVKVWRSIPFCPTLLDRPTSNAPADVDRRSAVRTRVLELNSALAEVCAEYRQCTTDGGAAFRAPVDATQLSTHDYWHPNIAGQSTLAELVWDTLGY